MGFNEAKVRDSLGDVLHLLEGGLTLIDKEYYLPPKLCTRGFIDLLARDDKGRYVLIEVKRTRQASRETAHEVLKYVESAKLHLGLRENELRVIVAAIAWDELLVPFSSLSSRTDIRVEGWQLAVDEEGTVVAAETVASIPIHSDRVLAPWHEMAFYENEVSLKQGIKSFEESCFAKDIESFVLVVMEPPEGSEGGLPSSKEVSMGGMLSKIAAPMGEASKATPDTLYRYIIYFAMQQLSRDGYKQRLPPNSETLEYIIEMDEEEALCSLHEAVLDLVPHVHFDSFEIGYPAKFKARLQEDEGWRITNVMRYGAFARNDYLTDAVLINEIEGKKGNSKQSLQMTFNPSDTSDVSDVRECMEECLRDNPSWRTQLNLVLDELANSLEDCEASLSIANMCSAITTVYLSIRDENGPLYIPQYRLAVPSTEPHTFYFGCLEPNATKAKFSKIVEEFYEGDVRQLLFTLQWGGYETRDNKITRRMGLRYRSYKAVLNRWEKLFYRLDEGDWEACEYAHPTSAYYRFMANNPEFVSEVAELYSSRWDGSVVVY